MTEYKCKYVIVRFLPDPAREEAINLGVILYCHDTGFVGWRFLKNLKGKVKAVSDDIEAEVVGAYLKDIEKRLEDYEAPINFSKTTVDQYLEGLWLKGFYKIELSEPKGLLSSGPSTSLDYVYNRFVYDPKYDVRRSFPKSFRVKVTQLFFHRKLLEEGRLVPHFIFTIDGRQTESDFGCERRNGDRLILIDLIDLFNVKMEGRLKKIAPTAIKFYRLLKERKDDYTFSLLNSPREPDGDLRLERDLLGEFSKVVIFSENQERSEFLTELVQKIT